MATTNDAKLAERLRRLRTHGITRNPAEMIGAPDGAWYYQQIELGLNYRMTDIQAALGIRQLSRLSEYVDRRHEIAERYDRELAALPLALPGRLADARSAFHLYVIRLNEPDRRSEVFDTLRAGGLGVNVHYIPVHLQPYYKALGFRAGDFPNAEAYYRAAISIPIFPALSHEEQTSVIRIMESACA